ncbi:hypothetical protein [Specibacter sp. NPDC078709]|uniref:hypothetical protein n=1 Tax=unclassified Specibacter TaxID=3081321 RepID=UPI003444E360
MKKLLVALPLAALLLAGCSSAAPTVDSLAGADSAVNQAEKPAAETAEKPADRSAALGETVTYESGVKVTVTSLGFQSVGEYAHGAIEGQAAVFELTVMNGSDEDLEAALMSLPKVTVGETNAQTESVTDMDSDLGLNMLSTILPGETQTVKFGAGIAAADAGAVRVEISGPNMFTDKAAIFKGAL